MKIQKNISLGALYIIIGMFALIDGRYTHMGASLNLGSYKYIVSFIFLFLGFFYIISKDK